MVMAQLQIVQHTSKATKDSTASLKSDTMAAPMNDRAAIMNTLPPKPCPCWVGAWDVTAAPSFPVVNSCLLSSLLDLETGRVRVRARWALTQALGNQAGSEGEGWVQVSGMGKEQAWG